MRDDLGGGDEAESGVGIAFEGERYGVGLLDGGYMDVTEVGIDEDGAIREKSESEGDDGFVARATGQTQRQCGEHGSVRRAGLARRPEETRVGSAMNETKTEALRGGHLIRALFPHAANRAPHSNMANCATHPIFTNK